MPSTHLSKMIERERIEAVRLVLADLYHRQDVKKAPNPTALLSLKEGVVCLVYIDGDDLGLRAERGGKILWDDGVGFAWREYRRLRTQGTCGKDKIAALCLNISDIITQE